MIKYKTIHVDTTSLDNIFKNVLDLHNKVSDIKCPTLQCPLPDTPEVKKYQEDRAKATTKVRLEQLKYMKEFFKLFKGRYIKLCWQGQKARYYHIGDVNFKVASKKELDNDRKDRVLRRESVVPSVRPRNQNLSDAFRIRRIR